MDPQLEAKRRRRKTPEERKKIEGLIGKVAVANTKLIYQKYKEIFGDARFEALAQERRPRPAAPVGLDQHQESQIQRHPLRARS